MEEISLQFNGFRNNNKDSVTRVDLLILIERDSEVSAMNRKGCHITDGDVSLQWKG